MKKFLVHLIVIVIIISLLTASLSVLAAEQNTDEDMRASLIISNDGAEPQAVKVYSINDLDDYIETYHAGNESHDFERIFDKTKYDAAFFQDYYLCFTIAATTGSSPEYKIISVNETAQSFEIEMTRADEPTSPDMVSWILVLEIKRSLPSKELWVNSEKITVLPDEAAIAAETKIAAIGEVTLDSKAAIEAARAAYDALSEDQKAFVESYAVLEKAEDTLDTLQTVLPFTDVSGWYADAVRYAYKHKLMNGVSADRFNPTGTTTRAMVVTILYRESGSAKVEGSATFTDTVPGAYYEDAVAWAAAKGVVIGYDDAHFGPEDVITREQMALILFRYAKLCGKDVSKRADVSAFRNADEISAWAEDAMRWAVSTGLIQGRPGGNLDPKSTITRAEVAQILLNFKAE